MGLWEALRNLCSPRSEPAKKKRSDVGRPSLTGHEGIIRSDDEDESPRRNSSDRGRVTKAALTSITR